MLIPYHSSLSYSGLGQTYVQTQIEDFRVIPFLIIGVLMDNFSMTLLFFVSGIASFYALKYKGKRNYINQKFKKILIPFLLGTIFICPFQAYFKALNEGFYGGMIFFIREFFSAKIVYYLGYAHLWFLLYLFLISLVTLPLLLGFLKDDKKILKISKFLCHKNNIYYPIVLIVLIEILLRPYFPGKQIIINDYANDILYMIVFVFGFIYAYDDNLQKQILKLFDISKLMIVISLVILFYVYYNFMILDNNFMYLRYLRAFAKGIYECFVIIWLMNLAFKYFNRRTKLLDYLNKASYTYYIFHFLPISAMSYFMTKFNLNIYIKYLLVVIISYVFVFLIYELKSILKRSKIWR